MFSWHSIPFARILVPFISGIFIALYFPEGFIVPAVSSIILFGISLFLHLNKNIKFNFRYKVIPGIFITLLVIFLGYLRVYWFNETRQPEYFAKIPDAQYYKITVDDA